MKKTKIIVDVFPLNDRNLNKRYYWNIDDEQTTDWIPASVVKTFAAAGALVKLTELGFGANTSVTFKDINETVLIKDLIEPAIIRSDNMTYNRLVQLAGHQNLNDNFLNRYNKTELNSPYMKEEWVKKTNGNDNFSSPEIILTEGEREHTIAAADKRVGKIKAYTSSVTTLGALNKLMIDLVFEKNIQMSEDHYNLLLGALRKKKPSGEEFSRSIINQVKNFNFTENYGKHGFNGEWYSQSFLLVDRNKNVGFNISGVGYPGNKEVLNEIGMKIGNLIDSGKVGL